MKKNNINFLLTFILLFILLFQDSIVMYFKLNFLNYLDEIIVLVLLFFSFISLLKNKKISIFQLSLLILILLFFSFGFFSCYKNSEFIINNVLKAGFLSIKFFLLIFSFLNLDINQNIKYYFVHSLELIAKIVLFVGIFNFIFPNIYLKIFSFAIPMRRFGLLSITSLFYHPGKFGWFMLFISLLYYSKYSIEKKESDKIWMIIYGISSLLSYRTKVIIGMFVIFLLVNIFNKKISLKSWILVLCGSLFIFTIFGNIILNTYNLYFSSDGSESARQVLIVNGVKLLKYYFPLGVGFGKYGSWFAKINYSEYYYFLGMNNIYGLSPEMSSYATDTFWPSIMGETGILGFLVFLAIIFLIIKKLKEKIITDNYYVLTFKTWAFLALIQSLCESFGEPSFNSSPQNIMLAVVIGISINSLSEVKK